MPSMFKDAGEFGRESAPATPMIEKQATTVKMDGGAVSAIGPGMSIVGKIDCNGPAEIFGRIEGEVRAADLLIGEGAQIEGNVVAQAVTICGRVKGTIRAGRVRLQGSGAVEGDIFHRSLSIAESSFFEGTSRRLEDTIDAPSNVEGNGVQKSSDEVNGELDVRGLLHSSPASRHPE